MMACIRRTRGKKRTPAVFLDRDGTIIHDRPGFYLTDPRGMRIYASAAEALRTLAGLGYRLIILTNQSGVGRGYMTLARSKAINRELCRRLARRGVRVDAVYFCPHAPKAGCSCRKPAGGLVREAMKAHPLDLSRSIVIGDKGSDMRLADSFGMASVMVRTGHGRSELVKTPELAHGRPVKRDLMRAAAWIAGLAARESAKEGSRR